jgi:hypothetical protein
MRKWFLLVLLSASVAYAKEDRFRTDWHAACKVGATSVDVHFKSRTGDPSKDDMVMTVQWGKARPTVISLEPSLFESTQFTTDAVNLCKEVGAFVLPSGRLLMLLSRDDRPEEDQLLAVVLDQRTGAVVQALGDVGAHGQYVTLIKEPYGYRVMLYRKWYIDPNSSGEFGSVDWLILSETGGKVVAKWEVDRK